MLQVGTRIKEVCLVGLGRWCPDRDDMRRYIVADAETLESIALIELGSRQFWLRVLEWNASVFPKEIWTTDRIMRGVVWLLPTTLR